MRTRKIGEIVTYSFEEDTCKAKVIITGNNWDTYLDDQYTGQIISGDLEEGEIITFNEVDLI